MALTREQKKKNIDDLKENLDKQRAMVFVSVEGLKAKELFDLRRKLKQANCLIKISKKTLLNIAFKEEKLDFDFKKIAGQPALIFGFEDEISPAKITYNFSLANKNLKILGGFFDKQFRETKEIVALAQIPSKQELLARVVWDIKAPIVNFVSVLEANIKGLITVLANPVRKPALPPQ